MFYVSNKFSKRTINSEKGQGIPLNLLFTLENNCEQNYKIHFTARVFFVFFSYSHWLIRISLYPINLLKLLFNTIQLNANFIVCFMILFASLALVDFGERERERDCAIDFLYIYKANLGDPK
jgi:hypothetical protein